MKYNLNDKPKGVDLFLYGVQWFTAILPFLIILSGVVSNLQTDNAILKTIYSQKTFVITGVALILQVLFGHRLPILTGPATILLIGLTSTLNLSPGAAYTAITIGGVLTILLSFGKFFSRVQKLFTTRVIVVTLLLVAITITPLIIKLSTGNNGSPAFNILFAVTLALIMIIANTLVKGIAKSLVILIGLLVGTVIYLITFGIPSNHEPFAYDLSILKDHLIIAPEFNISAIIAFFFCFLAITVNEFGAMQATAKFIDADNTAERSKKGLRISGFINTISGMLGVIGVVNYSMSPGIISATQSASRYPLIITGIILIICALIPQTLFVFSYIPNVVMGSVLLYIMCTQLSSGIQLMTSEKAISNFTNALVIAFPIMIGIFISFAPQTYTDSIPSLLQPILGNGFIMGIISVLILENILKDR